MANSFFQFGFWHFVYNSLTKESGSQLNLGNFA